MFSLNTDLFYCGIHRDFMLHMNWDAICKDCYAPTQKYNTYKVAGCESIKNTQSMLQRLCLVSDVAEVL